jgi:hydroxypyruvate isomerase
LSQGRLSASLWQNMNVRPSKNDPLMNRFPKSSSSPLLSRRRLLQQTAGLAAAGALALARTGLHAAELPGPVATRKRIKQSLVPWCWEVNGEKWNFEKICQVARDLGCVSVELTDPANYPTLKKYGLGCAIAQISMDPDPPFVRGFNNPDHWPKVLKATQQAIDAAAAASVPSVICFTGYSAKDPANPKSSLITKERGARNCVDGFKKVVGYAEKKGVTLCLEMLNTRDDSHPMKGHPGYMGDHVEYCMDILKKVGSPRLKLLFDVYHVQIMDGDIIRRLRQHKEYIGHVHLAGCPGRNELDAKQEINFPPILQTLLEIGYQGYVGLEFIPTRDPLQGLREAVALCDI